MFHGPAANIFEAATESELEATTRYDGYAYNGILLQQPRVLRWSQAVPQDTARPLPNDGSLIDFLHKAEQQRRLHFRKLLQLDILIPHYRSFIGCSPFDPDAIVLYDSVEFIIGDKLEKPDDLKRLGVVLKKYLTYCENSDDKLHMFDIFPNYQYLVTKTGQIALIDIEPICSPLKVTINNDYNDDACLEMIEAYNSGFEW